MTAAGEDPSLRLRFAAKRQNRFFSFEKFDQIFLPETNIQESFRRNSNIREPRSERRQVPAGQVKLNDTRRNCKGINRDKLLCSW